MNFRDFFELKLHESSKIVLTPEYLSSLQTFRRLYYSICSGKWRAPREQLELLMSYIIKGLVPLEYGIHKLSEYSLEGEQLPSLSMNDILAFRTLFHSVFPEFNIQRTVSFEVSQVWGVIDFEVSCAQQLRSFVRCMCLYSTGMLSREQVLESKWIEVISPSAAKLFSFISAAEYFQFHPSKALTLGLSSLMTQVINNQRAIELKGDTLLDHELSSVRKNGLLRTHVAEELLDMQAEQSYCSIRTLVKHASSKEEGSLEDLNLDSGQVLQVFKILRQKGGTSDDQYRQILGHKMKICDDSSYEWREACMKLLKKHRILRSVTFHERTLKVAPDITVPFELKEGFVSLLQGGHKWCSQVVVLAVFCYAYIPEGGDIALVRFAHYSAQLTEDDFTETLGQALIKYSTFVYEIESCEGTITIRTVFY